MNKEYPNPLRQRRLHLVCPSGSPKHPPIASDPCGIRHLYSSWEGCQDWSPGQVPWEYYEVLLLGLHSARLLLPSKVQHIDVVLLLCDSDERFWGWIYPHKHDVSHSVIVYHCIIACVQKIVRSPLDIRWSLKKNINQIISLGLIDGTSLAKREHVLVKLWLVRWPQCLPLWNEGWPSVNRGVLDLEEFRTHTKFEHIQI